MGVVETGQIIGATGVGETGVGKMGVIHVINVSKQTTLLDGVDVGAPIWRVSMGGLIDRVHAAINLSLMQRFI